MNLKVVGISVGIVAVLASTAGVVLTQFRASPKLDVTVAQEFNRVRWCQSLTAALGLVKSLEVDTRGNLWINTVGGNRVRVDKDEADQKCKKPVVPL